MSTFVKLRYEKANNFQFLKFYRHLVFRCLDLFVCVLDDSIDNDDKANAKRLEMINCQKDAKRMCVLPQRVYQSMQTKVCAK